MSSCHINGFADIHTHVLPFADDGAANMEQAIALVKMAWENGTRTLFLTPHYRGVYKRNTPEQLRERFDLLRRQVSSLYPQMELYLGQEILFQAEVPERIAEGRILTMCRSQYVLLEFRGSALRSQIVSGISETVRFGYVPVIAHAERYEIFRKDKTLVDEVLVMGALIQLNADSVMGKRGLGVKWFCRRLLAQQCVHFIASDTHDVQHRPPLLRECFLYVRKKFGAEYAARVFYHNARAIIENRTI